jgi:Acetyltransferase (GNAT) family
MNTRPLSGLAYLNAATTLLQRARLADARFGVLEAADLQWWWRTPRPTDEVPQPFWFDGQGQPEAALIATDWGDGVALDPILLPTAPRDAVARVVDRGLAHFEALGLPVADVAVDATDDVLREAFGRHGFMAGVEASTLAVTTAWLAAADRPVVSALPVGYRLVSRADMRAHPHHFVRRNGDQVEARLLQTSLYRPELDLLVLAPDGDVAAYSLFWFDPISSCCLLEPMRTEEAHRQRGLARHLLTAGVERLVQAGVRNIKLCFKPDNLAARNLYCGAGFVPGRRTAVLVRR